jgi:hypothetical protein
MKRALAPAALPRSIRCWVGLHRWCPHTWSLWDPQAGDMSHTEFIVCRCPHHGVAIIDEISALARRAVANHISAIRMHPETIAALKVKFDLVHASSWDPMLWGTPLIADETVPVGEMEVDR